MDLMDIRRGLMMVAKKARLPKEYQEVEWLKSTGTQYIKTDYLANNKTDAVSVVIKEMETYARFFGNMERTSTAFCLALPGIDYTAIRYGNNQVFGTSRNKSYLGEHAVRSNFTGYYIDNILIHSWNDSGVWSADGDPYKCDLFRYSNSFSNIAIKSLVIKEDGETVLEYIPCIRKADSKPGMYDTVSKSFYTNAGTGEFIIPT